MASIIDLLKWKIYWKLIGIRLSIPLIAHEWYVLLFKEYACKTHYNIFFEDGACIYRYIPISSDPDWMDNATRDREIYYYELERRK